MNQSLFANAAIRTSAVIFISATFCASLSVFPSTTKAEVVSVQTRQLLPAGNSACTPLSAYNFTPYVYDGALHSFEFTVPDSSYVALAGTVGDTPIPFQFMTRRGDASSALRVHVDIQTTPIHGMLPLSVTLLSAQGTGQSVCMSIVIMATTAIAPQPVATTGESGPTTTSKPTSQEPISVLPSSNNQIDATDEEDASPTASEAIIPAAPGFTLASIQNKIVESCATTGSAMRLWVILLVMYIAAVAIATLAQPSTFRTYSQGQRVATILTPLVLLLAFWYFTESCRATLWAPVAAILIALVSLLALFWNDSRIAPYVSRFKTMLKDSDQSPPATPSPSQPMITPPPTKKPEV